MTFKNLLEELLVKKTELGRVRIYVNPTKKEISDLSNNELYDEPNEYKYVAWMPSKERQYLYIWNVNEGLHNQVMNEIGIPTSAQPNTYKTGYLSIEKDYSLKFENDLDLYPNWKWLEKYTS